MIKLLNLPKKLISRVSRVLTSAARASQADVYPHQTTHGLGADWSPIEYGDYYAKSVPVFSAIRIRADAMTRLPWTVQRTQTDGGIIPISQQHPAQLLLDRPNPWFSGAELRRATETYLCLWGRAFWSIERSEDGQKMEIWPLRPDRMQVLPGRGADGPYIKGYLYRGLTGDVAYLPEEIEFFRFFNPLQDRTGMSPIAPMRLSADMGLDALRYNRSTLSNGGIPDYILLADDEMTDANVAEFYDRWEARFQGPNKANRPGIASFIKDVKPLAFSNRDLEFMQTLRWTVKDASRIFGVPETMLSELQFATLSNMEHLERGFWRNTIIPQATMMADRLTNSLLPKLGFTGLEVIYDLTSIEALNEGREQRVTRESDFLDRGVLTINEVRTTYNLPPVSWGNEPHFREANPFQQKPSQPNAAADENNLLIIPAKAGIQANGHNNA